MTKSAEKVALPRDPTTVAALARFTGVPTSSVYRALRDAGVPVRDGVPLQAAIRALIHARADLRPERLAIESEQHRKLRLANDEREGRLMHREEVLRAMDVADATFGAEIDGLPARVNAMLNGLTESARLDVLRTEATDLRRRIAARLRAAAEPQR